MSSNTAVQELLPEYAAPKPEKNRRKQRQADLESKKKDEEEGVVEDVEIYSIDKGWSDEYAEQFADEIDISDEASTRHVPSLGRKIYEPNLGFLTSMASLMHAMSRQVPWPSVQR